MKHLEQFKKKKEKAKEKALAGLLLNNSESIAIKDEWFYTIVLPVDVIQRIVLLSERYGIKPGDLGALYISQGLSKEKNNG